ncbi:hypothetical protein M422DRAFT_275229 [Sphaerobolus stellatus SS14]|uniref:Uncharacterized protein n=1 Tax=Sphaerobolus stellatus (strain SS14) TaxID=990650 RepID=A0A0C9UF28_SPHS4|nr:hypothetical protein M422DRAFT_275229 [Sphaerobolus stellatus SS14]
MNSKKLRIILPNYPHNEDLILENKRLKKELEYYVGRARYALNGKDAAWAERNGYRLSDIPASDGEDNEEDPTGLPTIPENIPQYILVIPPNRRAHTMSKTLLNNSKVIREAGIPAIGGYHPPTKQKRIIADSPASITGPAFRGASEWILEQDVHDTDMRRLYTEAKALQPHEQSPDHTAVMFCIDQYARSLPGLPRNLVVRHDDPDWMTEVIQSFNSNPSGVPQNLHLEGLHVNIDDADVRYWVNLIKPRYRGAEAEVLLQYIFSSVGRWDKLVAGRWKRNDSLFLCSPAPVRTIWNKVTLRSLLRANEIASLKGGEPFLLPPYGGGTYGEGGSFSQPPADARELWARISYFDSLVPQGTARASTAELTEELTHELYANNLE